VGTFVTFSFKNPVISKVRFNVKVKFKALLLSRGWLQVFTPMTVPLGRDEMKGGI
jgi:hypothetical protein